MARPCGEASTTFLTAAPRTYSAPSLPTRLWCWRISTATKSPMKFRRSRVARLACADRLGGHGRCHALSKKAFEQAAATRVHLIAQVKANQPALHHAIAALCDIAAPLDSTQTADKKRRCRDETRTVEVFAPGDSLADTEWDATSVRLSASIATYSPAPPPLGYGATPARPPCLSATSCCQRLNVPRPSVTTGTSRIAPTTSVTVASPRTPAASDAILASLRACARSLPTSCASTAFITSQMVGIASPSAASVQSSPCASCIER